MKITNSGLRRDLERKLFNDPAFAHAWLCHAVTGVCPDGCDTRPDPKRAAQYEAIEDPEADQEDTAG